MRLAPSVAVLMLAALLAAPVSDAARTGALSVRLEASVGESRPLGPGAIRWVVDGTALYGGLLEGQKSSLALYLTSAEPVAAYSLIAGWPTKLDIGGLEREETFVCGIVAIELGGPCFAVGPVAAIGSARIVEHDLRVGGRLVWELVFPRAVCLPCASL